MYVDKELMFSEEQTVTTGSDSGVLSTNVIDLGKAGIDIGAGKPMYCVVLVTTALEGAGDTCDVEVVSDSVATLNSSLTVVQKLGTFAAESPAGTAIIGILQPSESYERYVGLRYFARGSGALSAGAFTAFLTHNIELIRHYESGFTIS